MLLLFGLLGATYADVFRWHGLKTDLKQNKKFLSGATHDSVVDEVFDASFEVLLRYRWVGKLPVGDSSQLKRRVHVEKMRLEKRKSAAKVAL